MIMYMVILIKLMMVHTILNVDIEIDDDGDCYASFEDENGNSYEDITELDKDQQEKIREAFNLRSANFDLKYEDKKFVFTVRGFGHGVGMSQYGALFMAKEGSNYKEILKWYYTGCEIK